MEQDDDFERYLAEHDASNTELLSKYRVGQRVRVNLDEGSSVICEIKEIYSDFNGGPVRDVFVDVINEQDGSVYERLLAEDIEEILK